MSHRSTAWRAVLPLAGLLLAVTTACDRTEAGGASDSITAPTLGACRALELQDLTRATDDTAPVPCAEPHTAETFLVSAFTGDQADGDPDDERLGAAAYEVCQKGFIEFLGGDESLAMRSTLTWAWFRPSQKGWDAGARWFRCDVIGGGEQIKRFVNLPETAEGLLRGRPDDTWMVCADGPTVAGSVKLPCSEAHDWRAISTIQLGKPGDPYPGERVVEEKTRDFCSDQVGAWLNYPVEDYDFGFTWFHQGEWNAGNRRSVCWAKTER